MVYRKRFAFGELLEITHEARVHGKTPIESRNRGGDGDVTDAFLKRVQTLNQSSARQTTTTRHNNSDQLNRFERV